MRPTYYFPVELAETLEKHRPGYLDRLLAGNNVELYEPKPIEALPTVTLPARRLKDQVAAHPDDQGFLPSYHYNTHRRA